MLTQTTPETPVGSEPGLIIEHILLSVTVTSTKESAGQFDDTAARQVQKALSAFHGVVAVDARVLYEHTKIDHHQKDCKCGRCTFPNLPDPK